MIKFHLAYFLKYFKKLKLKMPKQTTSSFQNCIFHESKRMMNSRASYFHSTFTFCKIIFHSLNIKAVSQLQAKKCISLNLSESERKQKYKWKRRTENMWIKMKKKSSDVCLDKNIHQFRCFFFFSITFKRWSLVSLSFMHDHMKAAPKIDCLCYNVIII